jgi:hypothetical protein
MTTVGNESGSAGEPGDRSEFAERENASMILAMSRNFEF